MHNQILLVFFFLLTFFIVRVNKENGGEESLRRRYLCIWLWRTIEPIHSLFKGLFLRWTTSERNLSGVTLHKSRPQVCSQHMNPKIHFGARQHGSFFSCKYRLWAKFLDGGSSLFFIFKRRRKTKATNSPWSTLTWRLASWSFQIIKGTTLSEAHNNYYPEKWVHGRGQ